VSAHTCPEGHQSSAGDWCDVCGAPIGAAAPANGPDPAASRTCPEGHQSSAGDWCDVCGAPMGPAPAAGSSSPPPSPASAPASAPAPGNGPGPALRPCPHCGAEGPGDALFCEVCGYDFTTGALPPEPDATPAPAPADALVIDPTPPPATGTVEWVAEVWVDPDWHAAQDSDEACPSAGEPVVVPLRERSVLVGRTSVSRSIHPGIDCGADTGVSRRHAQLTGDGQRWWVEDLQSANGTFVGSSGGPLPTDALPAGQRRELADDERLYVGAWTRIVVRPATPDEKGA
jgi:hypothetical protein